MKLVIAGSRTLSPTIDITELIIWQAGIKDITEVISGKARGIDAAGEDFANANDIPIKHFPADWRTHGKGAGHIRNAEMAKYCDQGLLIWDGESTGTMNMKDNLHKLGKPYYLVIVQNGRYQGRWFNLGVSAFLGIDTPGDNA